MNRLLCLASPLLMAIAACDYGAAVPAHRAPVPEDTRAPADTAEPDAAPADTSKIETSPDTSEGVDTASPEDTTPPDTAATPLEVWLGDGESVTVVPEPPTPEPPPGPTRPRRRMDVDQLDAALRHATGGIGWTRVTNGVEEDLFVTLSSTLGKPDFINTTQEDLEPSSLLQKFLGEAARSACGRLAEEERAGLRAPVLMTAVTATDTWDTARDAVEANLVALLRRFHSSPLTPADPGFERWRWLFRSAAHISNDPVVAWRTVCVGLVTHPDFWTY